MSKNLQEKINDLKRSHVRELSTEARRVIEARKVAKEESAKAYTTARDQKAKEVLDRRVREKAGKMSEAEFKTIEPELRKQILLEDIEENKRRVNRGHLSSFRRAF